MTVFDSDELNYSNEFCIDILKFCNELILVINAKRAANKNFSLQLKYLNKRCNSRVRCAQSTFRLYNITMIEILVRLSADITCLPFQLSAGNCRNR